MPTSSIRSGSSTATHYFEYLQDLTHFEAYVEEKICSRSDKSCQESARLLRFAQYIDIDYDTVSQSVILSIFHAEFPGSRLSPTRHRVQSEVDSPVQRKTAGWNERIEDFEGSVPTEIGIFSNEKPTEPEELSLSGFLFVIGKDTKPSRFRWDLIPGDL